MDMHRSINEINFDLAIEAGRIGTWKRDLTTNLITQSAITSQILGQGKGETVIPFSLLDSYTYPEDLRKFREPLDAAVKNGQPFDIEFRIFRPSGELRWIATRGKSIKDQSGKPVQVVGVMFDITEKKQSAERFRLLTEYSPDAILMEMNHHLVYANPSARQLLSITNAHRITDHSFLDFTSQEFHKVVRAAYKIINENKPSSPLFDLQMIRTDGTLIDVQAVCNHIFWDGRQATQIMLRDLTELKKSQNQVQRLSERLKLVIEGTGEGIWEWNIANRTFSSSGSFNKIIGHEESEFNPQTMDWYNAIHPEDISKVQVAFQESLNEGVPIYDCEFRIKADDHHWKWVRARGAVVEQDSNGQPIIMAGTLTDITLRKQSDEMIWKHANLDALTSLPNRRLFHQYLEFHIHKAQHANRQLALLFIDLDGFKYINDLFGHDSGDLLLIESAQRIKGCLNESDIAARIGGDEFVVILSELSRIEYVESTCQKILATLAQSFNMGNNVSYVSASIGISLYPFDATAPEELIRKADKAKHVAKKTGKNRFAYFTTELDEKAHERLKIMNDLRVALPLDQFRVHYQPIVDLKTRRIVKAEALLRWPHPVMDNIAPSLFIPLAEEMGVITSIGNWMFKEAVQFCKQCASCRNTSFQIGINMSPIQFMSQDNDINWVQHLADIGLSGDRIVVEVTEGVLLNASDKTFNRFHELRKACIQIALDDFGTGYSSMSYLQKFEIDYIKIDKSFVHNITTDQGNSTIAETIIVMAHKLGKKVIAEGVETQEQLDYLTQLGCDYGQGFLFSKAVPPDQFMTFFAKTF
jgi:diguanylate cyclase (GGDEF)-like protein/PAS domain S-box-containing protein